MESWLSVEEVNDWAAHIFAGDDNHEETITLKDGQIFATAHPASPEEHPMGNNLLAYVESKVHHFIRERSWQNIVMVGRHARHPPWVLSDNEKNFKPFNWYRPTARIIDTDTLELACFPGRDYVQHYALITATYLSLVGREANIKYATNPDVKSAQTIFDLSLRDIGELGTVIIGYVDHLESFAQGSWQRPSGINDTLLSWQRFNDGEGQDVLLLGCMVSFWGDIAVQLIKALKACGMKQLLYIGKTAALAPEHRPNEGIATGDRSHVDDSDVSWESAFYASADLEPLFFKGRHANIASPLLIGRQWLAQARQRNAAWIDCEVGLMAQECQGSGVKFGYLHIISDNVAKGEVLGLWNERHYKDGRVEVYGEGEQYNGPVQAQREVLFEAIRRVLARLFGLPEITVDSDDQSSLKSR